MATTTTRRNLLSIGTTAAAYAAGASIVTGGIAIASQAKGAEPNRAEWDRLCEAHRVLHREELTRLDIQEARLSEWWKVRAQREPKPQKPDHGPLDTSLSLAEIIASGETPERKAQWARYETEKKEWQARYDADQAQFMCDVEACYTAAVSAEVDVLCKVRAYPVTSLAMLSEKTAILQACYGDELEAHDALALIADIKRLTTQEGR